MRMDLEAYLAKLGSYGARSGVYQSHYHYSSRTQIR